MDLVIQWTEQQEALADTAEKRVRFELQRADLYIAAGDFEGALQCCDDAFVQIQQENLKDNIYEEVVAKQTHIIGLMQK